MTITIQCQHCKQSLAVARHRSGSRLECPACGQMVVVSGAGEPSRSGGGVPEGGVQLVASQDAPPVEAARRSAGAAKFREKPAPAGSASLPSPSGLMLKQPELPVTDTSRAEVDSPLPVRPEHYRAVVLPTAAFVLIVLFALAALGVAFCAGYFWGRSTVPAPPPASLLL